LEGGQQADGQTTQCFVWIVRKKKQNKADKWLYHGYTHLGEAGGSPKGLSSLT